MRKWTETVDKIDCSSCRGGASTTFPWIKNVGAFEMAVALVIQKAAWQMHDKVVRNVGALEMAWPMHCKYMAKMHGSMANEWQLHSKCRANAWLLELTA